MALLIKHSYVTLEIDYQTKELSYLHQIVKVSSQDWILRYLNQNVIILKYHLFQYYSLLDHPIVSDWIVFHQKGHARFYRFFLTLLIVFRGKPQDNTSILISFTVGGRIDQKDQYCILLWVPYTILIAFSSIIQ